MTGDTGGMTVLNRRTGRRLDGTAYPPVILGILSAGGLVPFLKARGNFSAA